MFSGGWTTLPALRLYVTPRRNRPAASASVAKLLWPPTRKSRTALTATARGADTPTRTTKTTTATSAEKSTRRLCSSPYALPATRNTKTCSSSQPPSQAGISPVAEPERGGLAHSESEFELEPISDSVCSPSISANSASGSATPNLAIAVRFERRPLLTSSISCRAICA